MSKRISIVLGIVLSAFVCHGQDVHFTQYEYSPLSLNAAETGAFDGDWRFATVYRNQWRSIGRPFSSFSASYDTKLYFLPPGWAVGLSLIADRSGDLGLRSDQAHVSISHTLRLGRDDLTLGGQGGYIMRSFDMSELSTPEQFNEVTGIFDGSLPNSDLGLSDRLNLADASAGLRYLRRAGTFDLDLGVAVHHLNRPSDSFFGDDFSVGMRTNVYGGLRHPIAGGKVIIADATQMIQTKASQLNFGAGVEQTLSENGLGLTTASATLRGRSGFDRNGDAFMIAVGLGSRAVSFSFAYDINLSSLATATNNKGAFEMGLIYRSPSTSMDKTTIPCVRY